MVFITYRTEANRMKQEILQNKRENVTVKSNCENNKELVFRRWQNDKFEWTAENTKKIISVIQAFDKKVNEMYDAVEHTKSNIENNSIFKEKRNNGYHIEAKLTYELNDEAIPTADAEMMGLLYDATNWKTMPLVNASNGQIESREQQLYLNQNWDIELFDRPELKNIKIPYYVHALFVDSYTYTLNDMLYMDPDDFCIGLEIVFDDIKK